MSTTSTTIGADAAKLAGLQVDLLQKMRQGQITLDHLEWFIKLSKVQRDMLSGADLKKLEPTFFSITDDGSKKTSELLQACRDRFTAVSYFTDEELDRQFLPPATVTTRKFRKVVEADPENANKSADDLNQAEQITLRERLLMEIHYFQETGGEHLDTQNATLCAGSRYSAGLVPRVYWRRDGAELYVGWAHRDYRDGGLRSRSAVLVA